MRELPEIEHGDIQDFKLRNQIEKLLLFVGDVVKENQNLRERVAVLEEEIIPQLWNAYKKTPEYKNLIKKQHKNIYYGKLVEVLFSYPIITASKLSSGLGIHRETASKYLSALGKTNILINRTMGKYHFYINKKLLDILHKTD